MIYNVVNPLIIFSGWEKDPHNSKFEIKIRVPLIRSIAAYKANLKFFNLPIIGQGINNTTLSNDTKNIYCIQN